MEPIEAQPKRPWYLKKRWMITIAVVSIFIIGLANTPTPTPLPVVQSQTQTANTLTSIPKSAPQAPTQQTAPRTNTLSNDNYYTNVSGNSVHAPAYSNSIPDGASAQCRDGTYSFSQHRSGTCSHHGGVASWF